MYNVRKALEFYFKYPIVIVYFYFIKYIMLQKTLIISAIPLLLILGGCFGKSSDTTSNTLSSTSSSMNTKTIEQCQTSVQSYLQHQSSVKVDDSKKVQNGNNIVVDYIGRLDNGEVFDTSVETVAKECDLYNAARNYSEWLPFTVGAGQMIAGFDKGVIDMVLNETKTIIIPAAEAYGDATMDITKEEFWPHPDGTGKEFKAGEQFMTMGGMIEIIAVDDNNITIKNPNPLAWKDLIFDITIKEIK